MSDLTFRIDLVERVGEWVLLCSSPEGGCVVHVAPAITAAELEPALARLETAIVRSASTAVTRRAGLRDRTAEEFGRTLARGLITGEAAILLDRCRERARRERGHLTVLLHPEGPSVSRIPWEFLVDPRAGDDFLALRLPVARSPRLMQPLEPLAVTPPLRVLGVMPRPSDLPALQVDAERRRIAEAFATLSSELVELHWLTGDSFADLSAALRHGNWHVLHFIGHGGFDDERGTGYLELSDEHGESDQVEAAALGRLVADARLRLVVLNACESATVGPDGVFSSTAAKIMREGVPAVVAMQYEITDPAALVFSSAFYEAVAHDEPVDLAVTRAREAVERSLGSLEWATPVLLLASDQTRIFAVRRAVDAAPSPPPIVGPDDGGGTWQASVPSPAPTAPQGGDWAKAYLERASRVVTDVLRRPEREHVRPVRPRYRSPEPGAATQPRPVALGADLSCVESAMLGPSTAAEVGPGGLVALACTDGMLRVWSPTSRRVVARCRLPGRRPERLAWTPWRRHVATAQDDGGVVLWDLETEVPVLRLPPSGGGSVTGLAVSADGRWLAVGTSSGTLRVHDRTGSQVLVLTEVAGTSGVGAGLLAFSPDAAQLVVAVGHELRAVDARGRGLPGWPHPDRVSALTVDRQRIVTGTGDGRLRCWGWDRGVLARSEATAGIAAAALVPAARSVATVDRDALLRVWTEDARPLAGTRLPGPAVGLGVCRDLVVTLTADGHLQVWRAPGHAEVP